MDTPFQDILSLVKFAGKVKDKQQAIISVSTEEQLKSHSKAGSKLKDKPGC